MTNRWAERITLCGMFALIAVWAGWSTLWAGKHYAPIPVGLAVTILPLLVALPGLLHNRRGSFIWLGLMSLFYFVHGIVSLYAKPSAHLFLAVTETVASLLLFSGTFVRLRHPLNTLRCSNPTNSPCN